MPPRLPQKLIDDMAASYNAGLSLHEVARKHGVYHTSAYRHMRTHPDVTMRKRYRKRKRPQELIDDMAASYNVGLNVSEVAQRFHVCYSTAYVYVSTHASVTMRVSHPKPPQELIDGMAASYNDGLSISKVALKHGVSYTKARRCLISHPTVTLRGFDGKPKPHAVPSPANAYLSASG